MQESLTIKMDQDTLTQYRDIIDSCQSLFLKKTRDYGTSWRVLRPISLTDQIYIKAWRIRQIQQNRLQKVSDSIESEWVGIVNYGIIALIQQRVQEEDDWELPLKRVKKLYEAEAQETEALMLRKNHDYGEAWRQMNSESFVDLILAKLLRIRQILANDGKTMVSEGITANFADIVNYAVFALILLKEKHSG